MKTELTFNDVSAIATLRGVAPANVIAKHYSIGCERLYKIWAAHEKVENLREILRTKLEDELIKLHTEDGSPSSKVVLYAMENDEEFKKGMLDYIIEYQTNSPFVGKVNNE